VQDGRQFPLTALGRIYTFALWMSIEDDSSSVNVNDESWSISIPFNGSIRFTSFQNVGD
jgi:hypothetical protein